MQNELQIDKNHWSKTDSRKLLLQAVRTQATGSNTRQLKANLKPWNSLKAQSVQAATAMDEFPDLTMEEYVNYPHECNARRMTFKQAFSALGMADKNKPLKQLKYSWLCVKYHCMLIMFGHLSPSWQPFHQLATVPPVGHGSTNWSLFYQLANVLPVGQCSTNWSLFYQLANVLPAGHFSTSWPMFYHNEINQENRCLNTLNFGRWHVQS